MAVVDDDDEDLEQLRPDVVSVLLLDDDLHI